MKVSDYKKGFSSLFGARWGTGLAEKGNAAVDSVGISFHLSHKELDPIIKPIQQHLLFPVNLPWCHPTSVSCSAVSCSIPGAPWHTPCLVSSVWGAAFGALCTPKPQASAPHWAPQPEPALAELSCSQGTSRAVPAPLLGSRAGQIHFGGPGSCPSSRGTGSTSSPYPAWPKLEISGGGTLRMDAVFGLFLHHPHCPSDDSPCPCGHQKSLAGEIRVHLHFSSQGTRTSSLTESRAAVTSTQMGVNTMQPTSDLQITTWQLK